MTHDDQVINRGKISLDSPIATDYQLYQSENSNENELSYNWAMDEMLQLAKAYRISSDEESSDDNTSDDFSCTRASLDIRDNGKHKLHIFL